MDRPNILWIVAEDMCPNLGCYGDTDASTPNIDRLAKEGVRYTKTFSFAPICAPARSTLIYGVYPTTLGTQHMRSRMKIPENIKCFTQYLRNAGYYCFNGFEGYQTKFDYNSEKPSLHNPLPAWDAVSGYYPAGKPAHWRNRKDGQKFFAQIGLWETHQSNYGRGWPDQKEWFENVVTPLVKPEERKDRSTLRIPPYHPDTIETRELWAEYYECITHIDHKVGTLIEALEKDGLLDETIIFFFGDNGMGMPQGKSWVWEEGLNVPLIMRFPEKYMHLSPAKPGEVVDSMVSFEDFAPTVLNLAGLDVPKHMQGMDFLSKNMVCRRKYAYGMRGRVESFYDCSRTVRDRRYRYIRNFMPHRGVDEHIYSWARAPAFLEKYRKLAEENSLDDNRQRALFARTKPVEELYDIDNDPYELHNLAGDERYKGELERLCKELEGWMVRTHDTGLLSENMAYERSSENTVYETCQDEGKNPVQKMLDAVNIINKKNVKNIPFMIDLLDDEEAALRRWGIMGLLALKEDAYPAIDAIVSALDDNQPEVRILAAEALCSMEKTDAAIAVLIAALTDSSGFVRLEALLALDRIGDSAWAALPHLERAKENIVPDWFNGKYNEINIEIMVDVIKDRFGKYNPGESDVKQYWHGVNLKAAREKYEIQT